jgi:hypothetical protein
MKLDFALLADAATVDASGKLSILGVFDRIRARDFPARHGRIALVMRLSTVAEDSGGHRAEIRLVDPDGNDLVTLNGNLEVRATAPEGEETRVPQVLNLDGIAFPRAGRYRFEIRVDDRLVATLPLILEEAPGHTEAVRSDGPSGPEGLPVFFAPGGPAEA